MNSCELLYINITMSFRVMSMEYIGFQVCTKCKLGKRKDLFIHKTLPNKTCKTCITCRDKASAPKATACADNPMHQLEIERNTSKQLRKDIDQLKYNHQKELEEMQLSMIYLMATVSSVNRPRGVSMTKIREMEITDATIGGTCSACLENINVGNRVIKLECSHIYHSECIYFMTESSDKCAQCRLLI